MQEKLRIWEQASLIKYSSEEKANDWICEAFILVLKLIK